MVKDDVVLERLIRLRDEIAYLQEESSRTHSLHEYVENIRLRKAVERSLQVAVEICLDIGRRIIARERFRYPEDNQDVFRILAEEGIISGELLSSLLNMARFRNLIVHDYARIDDARDYALLKRHLEDFIAFADAVRVYLEDE
ncbi:MAG: DUF86 domain-containing protein [Anaerolineae bacterium]|nr:DUF86 domain-containing protein [Anaerolineae bacterium]